MWCLLSICANSFPLRSLSLASYDGERLGNLLDSDSVDLFLSWFVLFHLEDDCSMLQLLLALCLWHTMEPHEAMTGQWVSNDIHLLGNGSHLCQTVSPSTSVCLHLSPTSFHPELDSRFHTKATISAPLAKWVIILLAVPTLNVYKCSHTSNSFLAS